MAKYDQIPKAVDTKIYKTGQTRGADDDVIYQNRVARNSTVLIPYEDFSLCESAPTNKGIYENGFIVLIKPEDYFVENIQQELDHKKLVLGKNLLVFYETRLMEKIPDSKKDGNQLLQDRNLSKVNMLQEFPQPHRKVKVK